MSNHNRAIYIVELLFATKVTAISPAYILAHVRFVEDQLDAAIQEYNSDQDCRDSRP